MVTMVCPGPISFAIATAPAMLMALGSAKKQTLVAHQLKDEGKGGLVGHAIGRVDGRKGKVFGDSPLADAFRYGNRPRPLARHACNARRAAEPPGSASPIPDIALALLQVLADAGDGAA